MQLNDTRANNAEPDCREVVAARRNPVLRHATQQNRPNRVVERADKRAARPRRAGRHLRRLHNALVVVHLQVNTAQHQPARVDHNMHVKHAAASRGRHRDAVRVAEVNVAGQWLQVARKAVRARRPAVNSGCRHCHLRVVVAQQRHLPCRAVNGCNVCVVQAERHEVVEFAVPRAVKHCLVSRPIIKLDAEAHMATAHAALPAQGARKRHLPRVAVRVKDVAHIHGGRGQRNGHVVVSNKPSVLSRNHHAATRARAVTTHNARRPHEPAALRNRICGGPRPTHVARRTIRAANAQLQLGFLVLACARQRVQLKRRVAARPAVRRVRSRHKRQR